MRILVNECLAVETRQGFRHSDPWRVTVSTRIRPWELWSAVFTVYEGSEEECRKTALAISGKEV